MERRSELVVRRSRKRGDAIVTLAITAAIILIVLVVISMLVAAR